MSNKYVHYENKWNNISNISNRGDTEKLEEK